jgi:transposase
MPKGRYSAQHHIPDLLEDAENGLPTLARRLLHDTYLRLRALHEQVLADDRELNQLARQSTSAQRRMTVLPGVGAITATAVLASVGDPRQFRNARQFAAWLGLTPKQYTTGGRIRLGRITKKGDAYLRTLLIHGTRAVLATVKDKDDRLSLWIQTLIARRGYKRAAVALAAKHARILWAMMVRGEPYQLKTV